MSALLIYQHTVGTKRCRVSVVCATLRKKYQKTVYKVTRYISTVCGRIHH